jgi:hypothetical protein
MCVAVLYGMRALLRIAALVAAALTAGCGGDAATTLRDLGSWAATAAMIGRAWADAETPRAYTLRALARAQRELGQRQRRLDDVPEPIRSRAAVLSEDIQRSVAALGGAVEREERDMTSAMAAALEHDARALQALAERAVLRP